jgi:hypothetical protein
MMYREWIRATPDHKSICLLLIACELALPLDQVWLFPSGLFRCRLTLIVNHLLVFANQ